MEALWSCAALSVGSMKLRCPVPDGMPGRTGTRIRPVALFRTKESPPVPVTPGGMQPGSLGCDLRWRSAEVDGRPDSREPHVGGAHPRPLSRSCISPGPGFRFGHLLFDSDVRPALDILFPPGARDVPVGLMVEGDGALTVGWASGKLTDLGHMNRAVVRAYRRHRRVDVSVGTEGDRRVVCLELAVVRSLARVSRAPSSEAGLECRRDRHPERNNHALGPPAVGLACPG